MPSHLKQGWQSRRGLPSSPNEQNQTGHPTRMRHEYNGPTAPTSPRKPRSPTEGAWCQLKTALCRVQGRARPQT